MEYELIMTILLFIIVILMCYKIFYVSDDNKEERKSIIPKPNKKIIKMNTNIKNKNNIDLNSLEDIDPIIIDN